MIKQYRTEYPGEYVVIDTVFRDGKKEQKREWVENPITVTSSNHRACCIGPNAIDGNIPLVRIERHPGGLQGCIRMQLYGIDDLWEHMSLDFVVTYDRERLAKMIESGYQVDHVVYTTPGRLLEYPGEFYLIPHGVTLMPAATAIWLACFDGHKDIYLYGYNPAETETKLINAVKQVMQTYSDVTFHHVAKHGNSPDAWRRCRNFKIMSRDEFISECDI